MNANTVFEIAKVLPREEQKKLLKKLQDNLVLKLKCKKVPIESIFTKEDALRYLLENVIRKK